MAEAVFYWEPSEDRLGVNILCFTTSDGYQTRSAPSCMVVVVTGGFEEVLLLFSVYIIANFHR